VTGATFPKCGHPRTPENSRTVNGGGSIVCRFCRRMNQMARAAGAAQKRINAGGYTLGERIASGAIE
jgi:hypothetical protein